MERLIVVETVYLIEHRENDKNSGAIKSIVACVVSSLEKAVSFMKENTDYDSEDNLWWWAVNPMIIDDYGDGLDDSYLFNQKVERIYWESVFYGKLVELGSIYEFDLSFGKYNYLENYTYKGQLVDTKNEKLTFKEVKLFRKGIHISWIGRKVVNLNDLVGIYEAKL